MKLKGRLYHRLPHGWPGGSGAFTLTMPSGYSIKWCLEVFHGGTIDKAPLGMLVALEALMHFWEFINHLGEAAMGLTFGEIRVRPTLCPTFQDFLTCDLVLVYSGPLKQFCFCFVFQTENGKRPPMSELVLHTSLTLVFLTDNLISF